jgi:hypothetical protein
VIRVKTTRSHQWHPYGDQALPTPLTASDQVCMPAPLAQFFLCLNLRLMCVPGRWASVPSLPEAYMPHKDPLSLPFSTAQLFIWSTVGSVWTWQVESLASDLELWLQVVGEALPDELAFEQRWKWIKGRNRLCSRRAAQAEGRAGRKALDGNKAAGVRISRPPVCLELHEPGRHGLKLSQRGN